MLKIESLFVKGLSYLAVFFFSLSFLLYGLQTFLRIFFETAILWIDPVSSYLFALSALYGATLAIINDENIKIEIFKKLNHHKKIVFLKNTLAGLATLFLLVIFFRHLQEELIRGEMAFLNLKKWMLDIPYIFFLLGGLVFYINKIIKIFNPTK